MEGSIIRKCKKGIFKSDIFTLWSRSFAASSGNPNLRGKVSGLRWSRGMFAGSSGTLYHNFRNIVLFFKKLKNEANGISSIFRNSIENSRNIIKKIFDSIFISSYESLNLNENVYQIINEMKSVQNGVRKRRGRPKKENKKSNLIETTLSRFSAESNFDDNNNKKDNELPKRMFRNRVRKNYQQQRTGFEASRKTIKCQFCGRNYVFENSLIKHFGEHFGKKPLKVVEFFFNSKLYLFYKLIFSFPKGFY